LISSSAGVDMKSVFFTIRRTSSKDQKYSVMIDTSIRGSVPMVARPSADKVPR
jgi:hypothetical protein